MPATTDIRPALDKRDWIAGLEKGLSVMERFDDANLRMTASQTGLRSAAASHERLYAGIC